jgi:hypothetical protein
VVRFIEGAREGAFYRWRGEGRAAVRSVVTAINGGGARVGAAVSGVEGARRRRRRIEDAWWWEGRAPG